jgi:hypothetical protein
MMLANSGSLSSSNGAKFVLPQPVTFPDGHICERIRIEAAVPVKNTHGSNTHAVTNTDDVSLFSAIFGNFSLNWGKVNKEVVDNALIFTRMREMHAVMSQRDQFFIPPVAGGAGGELRNQGTETYAANTAYTATLELHRTFVIERMGQKQTAFCPGATQMRSLDLSFVRGAVWVAQTDVTENGSASISVIFDTSPSPRAPDRWARVPRLFLNEQSGLEQHGPDGGGALISLWHYNAAASSNGGGLGIFTLYRDGKPIHDTISATRVTRDEYVRLPLGGYDANNLATILLDMVSSVGISDLWVGGDWMFRQASTDLSPPKTAWLHVPAISDQYRDDTVGPNIVGDAEGQRSEALLVVEPIFLGQSVPLTHTSVMPMLILDRAHPAFASAAGRLFQRGAAPVTRVPDAVKAAAAGASQDQFTRLVAATAAQVPAGAGPTAGELTGTAAGIANHIAPPAVGGRKDFATGLAARYGQLN